MKTFLAVLSWTALFSQSWAAIPDWPSSIDELEDLMFLAAGYRARGMLAGVTPCSKSPAGGGAGRNAAAEWLRTAFHDMAPADVINGIGGLDGSLMFETGRSENVGSAFTTTLLFFSPFFTAQSSVADLIALGTYASVRSCGGPLVPVRQGRIDAAAAGPNGVPEPQNPTGTFIGQFGRMGFNQAEAIQLTACGHTLGGVHADFFPVIVPVGTGVNNEVLFDDPSLAATKFDHGVARDFLLGNTTNPLVVGPAVAKGQDSDGRLFASDGKVAIIAMNNPASFQATCATVLQKMIDVVPPGVILTDPIQPYEVKPSNIQLTLLDGGASLQFAGEIRVRTTTRSAAQIASVKLVYKDRDGASSCGSCSIDTTVAGDATGFDDSFTFFKFSTTLSSTTSISSFDVIVTQTGGTVETFDNNGVSYPVQDVIIYQYPNSCLDVFTNAQNQRTLTVFAAVRNSLAATPVSLDLAQKIARTDGTVIPSLVPTSISMTAGATSGPYTLFSTSVQIGSTLSVRMSFDVSVGSGTSKKADTFKLVGNMGNSCAPFDAGSGSSSSSSSSSSTSSTSSASSSSSSASSASSSSSSISTSISSSTSTSTTAAPTSTGWNYLGCYTDSVAARSLPNGVDVPGGAGAMTNELCQATCQVAGYTLAGTEYSGECYCGNSLVNDGAKASDGEAGCNMPCNGDSGKTCGGSNRLSLFGLGGASPNPTSTSTAPTSTPTGWSLLGCYTDSVAARSLPAGGNVPGGAGAMTNELCQASCKSSGYTLAGTEYSGECYCGNTLENGGAEAPDGDAGCNMACYGDENEICGGSNRLSLYSYYAGPASTTSTGPVVKATVGPYTYLGCQIDSVEARVLDSSTEALDTMTLETCQTFCGGSTYFGLEYGRECWCGDSFVNPTTVAPDSDCSSLCAGDSSELCGAGYRLSVYHLTGATSKAAVAAFAYDGCYTDDIANRALDGQVTGSDAMTLEACALFCDGFEYFGAEWSKECWCGNTLGASAVAADEGDCNMPCTGSAHEACGAGNRLSVYSLTAAKC